MLAVGTLLLIGAVASSFDDDAGGGGVAPTTTIGTSRNAAPESTDDPPASGTPEELAWYAQHRDTLVEMGRAATNLARALRAEDGVNISRFSIDLSIPAGDLLAADPPDSVTVLATLAMQISGAAADAYVADDYERVQHLFEQWEAAQAAVLDGLRNAE